MEPDDDDEDDEFDDGFDPIVSYLMKELAEWRQVMPLGKRVGHDGARVHYMNGGRMVSEIVPH